MKGPKPKPDDEKMIPDTIRLMRKTRVAVRKIAQRDGVGIGKWMRNAIEKAVDSAP